MVEAAPAEEPQIAVVPGRMPVRAISQPDSVLTPMTERTTSSMSGQFCAKVPTKSSDTMVAIISASTTCTTKKKMRGRRIVPPQSATTMPASIGPISSAAGKPAASSGTVAAAERMATRPHCRAAGSRPRPGCGDGLSLEVREAGGKSSLRKLRPEYRVGGPANRAK